MTDQEIVDGLIRRDNRITEQFLYRNCRPLLSSIMRLVFRTPVDYDEMVSELYGYLMENDASKLRNFQFKSTLYQWMKVVATRFFIRHRSRLIEDVSSEPLYQQDNESESIDTVRDLSNRLDINRLLAMLPNRRYAQVIENLMLKDREPEEYAAEIGVTVGNLYNIKKRAIAAFAKVASKYYSYGR